MSGMRVGFGDRTVIVTGGTGALGGAVVERFLEAGARVLVTYVVDAEVAPFRERFAGQEGRVELRRCDLRRADEVEALLGRVGPGLVCAPWSTWPAATRGHGWRTPPPTPWSTCWT